MAAKSNYLLVKGPNAWPQGQATIKIHANILVVWPVNEQQDGGMPPHLLELKTHAP